MTITQLIEQLQSIQAQHGDLAVRVPLHDGGISVALDDDRKPLYVLLLDEELARAW